MRNAFNWLAILLASLLGLMLAILTALLLVGSAGLKPRFHEILRSQPDKFVLNKQQTV
jgi:hypothetical protein